MIHRRGESKFIVFEGIDGSGKTTMINKAYEELKRSGYDVLVTREPGGTDLAENLRSLVLSNDYKIDTDTERLIFFAARCHHTKHVILPFLTKGHNTVVLCDRYVDSTLAYQSATTKELEKTREWAQQFEWLLRPDTTIYLRIPTEVSNERIATRFDAKGERSAYDRIENLLQARIEKIRRNFEYMSKDYDIVDGTNHIDKVSYDVLSIIFGKLGTVSKINEDIACVK